jgi:hypothetical protein
MHQLKAVRILAGSDGADVPDNELARIEIGGRDQQKSTFPVLLSDALKNALCEVSGNGPRERCRIHYRVVVNDRHHGARVDNVIGVSSGVHGLKRPIEVGAEKREGSCKGARTRAGDDLELGPATKFAPTNKKAGRKGTVLLPSGQCEERCRCRQSHLRTPTCEGPFEFHSHRGHILARKARILDMREGEVGGKRRRNGAIPVTQAATDEQELGCNDDGSQATQPSDFVCSLAKL